MIKAFIIIRIKQLYRGLKDVGLFRLIFLLGLIGFFGFFLFTKTSEQSGCFFIVALSLLLILLIQTNRKDKRFLKSHFDNYRVILFSEYLLLLLPLIIMLAVHLQWLPVVILVPLLLIIPAIEIKIQSKGLNTRVQKWIPSESFEWKGGIRKNLFIIGPVWLIGLLTSFFIGSVPIAMFIIGIIIFSFYEKGEPYQMIVAFEMKTSQFLVHKVKTVILLYSAMAMPLIIAFTFFHSDNWYVPVIEYIIFVSLLVYGIFIKYAFYEPNCKSSAGQILGSIGILGGIIPFLLPVVWLLSLMLYFKSEENLNLYLNDYN